jgi:transcriptional regulator with XRE-family HTH domain
MDYSELETSGIRLIRLREKLGKTQRDFAIGLTSQPHLSEMERDVKPLSKKTIENIGSRYPQVNIHWLMTGSGEMFLEKKYGEPEEIMRVVGEPAADDGEGLSSLRELETLLRQIVKNNADLQRRVAALESKKKE